MCKRTIHHGPSRRSFLKTGALVTGAMAGHVLVPPALRADHPDMLAHELSELPELRDPKVRQLVQTGIDAAKSAGADYADARLSFVRVGQAANLSAGFGIRSSYLYSSVRVLRNGIWGFASGSLWTQDEMMRLGKEAVRQAKANDFGTGERVVLPPVPAVKTGHWESPAEIDPWKTNPFEVANYVQGINEGLKIRGQKRKWAGQHLSSQWRAQLGLDLYLHEQAFGSTDGSYYTQRRVGVGADIRGIASVLSPIVGSRMAGLEHLLKVNWEDLTEAHLERAKELSSLPVIQKDVGKYNLVLSAECAVDLVTATIGDATESDRVLGTVGHSDGSSFIDDPEAMLGSLKLGPDFLNISANRDEPGYCGTVGWDDEGVKPRRIQLVKNGILNDFQTNQDGAFGLRKAYERLGRPVESNGYAAAEHAYFSPLSNKGNLVLEPGSTNMTITDLEKQIGDGLTITTDRFEMDFQCASGFGQSSPQQSVQNFVIKNGKRVGRLADDLHLMFRTTELWKSLIGVGGPDSESVSQHSLHLYSKNYKGQPRQLGFYSAMGVPVAFKDVSMVKSDAR